MISPEQAKISFLNQTGNNNRKESTFFLEERVKIQQDHSRWTVRMLGCVLCLPVHARFRWGHLDLPLLFLQWLSTWLIVEVKPLDRKAISEFWFLMKKCIIFWVKGEGEVTVLQNNCWDCVLKTELGKLIPLKQFPQGYYKDLAL